MRKSEELNLIALANHGRPFDELNNLGQRATVARWELGKQ